MQELQRKQKEAQILNDMLNDEAGAYRRSLEGRMEHNRDLQYNQHKNLFATGYSTIHKAAIDGSESGIIYHLTKKEKPRVNVDDYDRFGICSIHYAAERGYDDVIRLLVTRGCPVDVRTVDGMTAFMYACKNKCLATMELLTELKTDLMAVNRAGMSCCHFAAQLNHVEVFEKLLELTVHAKERAIQEIADLEMMQENPDAFAAEQDKRARAEQKKANEKEGNEKHDADLHGGDDKATGGVVIDDDETLTTASGKKKKKDKKAAKGAAAGHIGGNPDEDEDPVEAMKKRYADFLNLPDTAIIDIASKNGTRPIHIAATYNALELLQFLIDKGCAFDATDTAGETSMHKAARRSNNDAYKMLKEAGADEYVKNSSRETPFDLLKDATMI